MNAARHFLAFGLLATAMPAHAAPCAPPDPEAVTATLRSMFAAAAVDDGTRLNTVFAPGFYAYDGGTRFDGTALTDLIRTMHGKGTKFVWSVQAPDVHIACNTAWIAYVNRGAVGDAKGVEPVTWLESANLAYDGNAWRVVFLHSTRQAPATP